MRTLILVLALLSPCLHADDLAEAQALYDRNVQRDQAVVNAMTALANVENAPRDAKPVATTCETRTVTTLAGKTFLRTECK